MNELIYNNPFRILGVYADASASEIKRNETKIRRFLEVGKNIEFEIDSLGDLPAPKRDQESVEHALSLITSSRDRLLYALFWYTKSDLYGTNQIVHSLCQGDLSKCSIIYHDVILNQQNCKSFEESILGSFSIDKNDFVKIFIDGLLTLIKGKEFLDVCKDFMQDIDYEHAKESVIANPLSEINSSIAASKNADVSTPKKALEEGKKLITSTKKSLQELKELLGVTDSQYQTTADALAKQILQLGINYYNASEESDKIAKALTVQKYALSIAVGKLTRERCQQNVDILLKHQQDAAPTEVFQEDLEIKKELSKFCSLPDKISYSIDLLKNTSSYLISIKEKLGVENSYYLKISTQVAGNALHNLIEEVNAAQKPNKITLGGQTYDMDMFSDEARRKKIQLIRITLQEAWKAIQLIDKLDLEEDFKKNRYIPNRNTLKDLCSQAGISTYSGSWGTSSTKPTTSTNSNSKPTPTSESAAAWVICILIIELIWGLIGSGTDDGFWTFIGISLIFWLGFPINVGVMFLMFWICDKIKGL